MVMLLLMLFSFILAALSVVSLVKNFLVNFNVSDNGWKTVLAAVLLVLCLFAAVIGYAGAYTVREIKAFLLSPGQLSAEEIASLKEQIPINTTTAVISIVIGYIAYLINMIIIKNIKENKLRQIDANKQNRWVKKA